MAIVGRMMSYSGKTKKRLLIIDKTFCLENTLPPSFPLLHCCSRPECRGISHKRSLNLSRKNGTVVSQSSTYQVALPVRRAIDGNKGQTYEECSHTALGQSIAWFQVDLGGEYSLKSVTIYYRNETNWPPYRFRQFYLDVSNGSAGSTITLTSQRKRCYKDNITAPATPPAVIDIPCKETARYVIVETTYDAPEDNILKETGPVLEICEIEVYGCSVGRYGESCSPCQGCSTCDIISGACPCSDTCVNAACNPSNGYCTEGCITEYWGNTCKSQCSQHCIGNMCEQGNGTCTNDCAEFRYGYTCEHQCSPQCSPRTCDRVTGACSDCNAGYHGLFCNITCSPYCKSGTCDAHNGHCIGGCKANWTGNLCDKCGVYFFGPNCSNACSVYCKGNLCNNVTGSCTDGCEIGYYKDKCKWTCNPGCKNGCNKNSGSCDNGCIDGKYGNECYDVCSVGCISNCERMTGNCMCKRGWQGEKCRECSPTFYGPSCEEECSPHCYNGTCYVNNGSCIDGCTRDYTGDKCTQGLYETSPEDHGTAIGAGVGTSIFVVIVVVVGVVTLRLRRKRNDSSKAQKDERKESKITYEKERTNANRQDHSLPGKDHSLPDSHVHLGKRPENLETQEIGLYEIMDSGNEDSKTYENDANAKSVTPVTNTSNDASEENGNVYLVINESQLNSSHYDELHVQN
ncbi:multiple epidermal growth factor-like domains protein 10 [Ostrea edulis]|uniref:multiple epidermal growth factor-like domains protein 10 n=1 Tax=Ostrea edulis TaxID=37623 RepID=UPI0024AF9726|nr:multiple epidermal growth factor-like domains protein 10 [Ostrea edulis]